MSHWEETPADRGPNGGTTSPSWPGWERLGIPQEEVANVAREREIWSSQLDLFSPRPDYG